MTFPPLKLKRSILNASLGNMVLYKIKVILQSSVLATLRFVCFVAKLYPCGATENEPFVWI